MHCQSQKASYVAQEKGEANKITLKYVLSPLCLLLGSAFKKDTQDFLLYHPRVINLPTA